MQADRALLGDIPRIRGESRRRYGGPRIHAALQSEGQHVGRKGSCSDNAPGESVFGRLKTELEEDGPFLSRQDAKSTLFSLLEAFYDRTRLHSATGYKTPADMEQTAAAA